MKATFAEQKFSDTEHLLDDTDHLFDDFEQQPEGYKTWEEIPAVPASASHFNTNTSQTCFVALNKNEAIERINEQSLPVGTKAYEYKENIHLKENEVILKVELDTSNMFDATKLSEHTHDGNSDDTSLIRAIQSVTYLGYTNYVVVYIIQDNRSVKNLQKIG